MIRTYSKKCRLCRAAGEKMFLKGDRCYSVKCPIDRKGAVPPGQHGAKRKRKISDYGIRLAEKQKLKKIYGLNEKQMKNCFTQARKEKGATRENMIQLLESRLDNIVFRLGFSPSRRLSRQLVSHKHISVNGKPVNISSFKLKPGDIIALDTKALAMTAVKSMLEKKDFKILDFLERKAAVGKFSRLPKRDEVETNVNEQMVVEHYSR